MKQEFQSFRRFFQSRAFFLVLFSIAILFVFGFGRAYFQNYKIRQEIKRLEEDVQNLEQKKIESLSLLAYVTSQKYVEDTARVELGMKKPGEEVVIISDSSKESRGETRDGAESVEASHIPTYKKWWYYFIDHSLPQESDT
ncbi:MAG TPA: hypothetical protein DCY48_02380 [Candidatus Magasanikbacteria bacterium]|nr:MAG: hypothetical protein A3I74_01295 [Candidatus Magasanikbacteria bacterium RIFCSPLOWO2_02_FULL_47_16]OGH79924.1 MAG: hypothetical protein A3C10_01930 [Candidatus Magasanikbacteria bacterium RIFCSPHIGHO2_02_FULL_48_18]OGH81786.1 MAG: hypothetical protein A3G08_01580 [Candidatus Magasanikbacteria bacterium RIFCSPLOWO2_12_FULL_47_9b]HAZ28600.1 hypothetical protein [Candidatus Magasanikbacteria bacterium]